MMPVLSVTLTLKVSKQQRHTSNKTYGSDVGPEKNPESAAAMSLA